MFFTLIEHRVVYWDGNFPNKKDTNPIFRIGVKTKKGTGKSIPVLTFDYALMHNIKESFGLDDMKLYSCVAI